MNGTFDKSNDQIMEKSKDGFETKIRNIKLQFEFDMKTLIKKNEKEINSFFEDNKFSKLVAKEIMKEVEKDFYNKGKVKFEKSNN